MLSSDWNSKAEFKFRVPKNVTKISHHYIVNFLVSDLCYQNTTLHQYFCISKYWGVGWGGYIPRAWGMKP